MTSRPDHRRLIFSIIAAVCILGAGVWYLTAKAESDRRRQLDSYASDMNVSPHLENINRRMQGLAPLPVKRINTDPGIPTKSITILFLIGVASAGAALAIRPTMPSAASEG